MIGNIPLHIIVGGRRRRVTVALMRRYFPDRIPVTPETFNSLAVLERRFYRHRPMTELAALCLRNEAARNRQAQLTGRSKKSVFPPRKRPQSLSGRPEHTFMTELEWKELWAIKTG